MCVFDHKPRTTTLPRKSDYLSDTQPKRPRGLLGLVIVHADYRHNASLISRILYPMFSQRTINNTNTTTPPASDTACLSLGDGDSQVSLSREWTRYPSSVIHIYLETLHNGTKMETPHLNCISESGQCKPFTGDLGAYSEHGRNAVSMHQSSALSLSPSKTYDTPTMPFG